MSAGESQSVRESASDGVVRVSGLSRRFGQTIALDSVDLEVPRGGVFGLVGENGAGKTTLIKHVLGLLKAQAGTVRVFGRDPVRDPVGVLARVGYLSEDRDLPEWMRIEELMRYLRAFYPAWDDAFAEELRRQFDLDPQAKIKGLSQGQKARAGLLAALAYRPELLVLDEPSTGLDPVVRREILAAIIRTIAEEGRTVLFSSHLLDEVERVSDHVAMIDRGRIVLCGPLDAVKAAHRRLTLRFDEPRARPPVLRGAWHWEGFGQEWTGVCDGAVEEISGQAAGLGARIVEEHIPSLDEIFVARVGSRQQIAGKE
ncbi:ABC-2 type transport system ATP-binding protein [Singulisphaera sp. GP187]|uniref:ABC transporter ATP-binding protein n=1 Tax=Singulisphaera sp. GP187 TaxID=1882752 RepID=UPI0009287E2F|nr:ABC transporter ATP-binding protein [Singulisphaera sp. GP187]SIO43486.1 ABC-2 type transport system ATP-binding protein [Singulisphaera sp. GP187]